MMGAALRVTSCISTKVWGILRLRRGMLRVWE